MMASYIQASASTQTVIAAGGPTHPTEYPKSRLP